MAIQTTQTAFNSVTSSTGAGTLSGGFNGVTIDNRRRMFNLQDRLSELEPQQSPFFTYLSKLAKKPTNDPIFKLMEHRHQWQRRYGIVVGYANSSGTWTVYVVSPYDKYGRELYTKGSNLVTSVSTTTTDNHDRAPKYFLANQMVTMKATDGTMCNFYVDAVSTGTVGENPSGTLFETTTGVTKLTLKSPTRTDAYNGKTFAVPTSTNPTAQTYIQIVGSAFAEGSQAPDSWHDEMWDREGYCQIFKTTVELFSGTAMATELRGKKNEYQRIWAEKMKEHKADMEQAFLFQTGMIASNGDRYTWGILPFAESYGKVYNFNYASSNYDSFLDAMEDFFQLESGNSGRKLVLASRKVINWFNRLGRGSYLMNTAGSAAYNIDIQNTTGKFGHNLTDITTPFGTLTLVQEPYFRNGYEDYCAAVDLSNVALRPLVGNGISRDTFITQDIQDRKTDGKQDLITTEAGLEVSLPETHAVFKFN